MRTPVFAHILVILVCGVASVPERSFAADPPPPPAASSVCPSVGSDVCPICGSVLNPHLKEQRGTLATVSSSTAGMRSVTTDGQTVILELAPGDLLPSHLMDLQGKTIRFTPAAGGYQVQALSLSWDPAFGAEIFGDPSRLWTLTQFQFPFSGSNWSSLYLGRNGNITFGANQSAFYDPSIHRGFLFRDFAGSMINKVPIISPLFHKLGVYDPDNVGHRYAKELSDRLVVTWLMSEPYRDTFSFTSNPLMNQFQAVLYSNGVIDFSYLFLSLQEGIVGVFPVETAPASWVVNDAAEPGLPDYLDMTRVYLSVVDATTLRATFELRGQPLPPGDTRVNGMVYRIWADTDPPYTTTVNFSDADTWFGVGGGNDLQYHTDGAGTDLSSLVFANHTLSFNLVNPVVNTVTTFSFFGDTPDFDAPPPSFDQAAGTVVTRPQVLGTIHETIDSALPEYIDVHSVAATLVGNASIRFTLNFRGKIPAPGEALMAHSIVYRIFVDLDQPFVTGIDFADADVGWGVFTGADLQYHAFGPGISSTVQVNGTSLSFMAPISGLNGASQFAFFSDCVDFSLSSNSFDQGSAVVVTLPAGISPIMDLSSATGAATARPIIYESFYYEDVPTERLLTPTVISALGDQFDFMALYTDFRIDRQETGSAFSGPIGNLVSNVNPSFWQPADWGSAGRIQGVQLINWIDTPMASPSGADIWSSWTNYNHEVTLLSHELGHRWLSLQKANVGANMVAIGDTAPHWLQALSTPVLVPHLYSHEASCMGGSWWQDNGNGTFTDLTQPFFEVGGYSPMDLYFMGLLPKAEVPSFFLVQNLVFSHNDGGGRPVYTGSRLNVTIDDVTAVSGDRMPAWPSTQRRFNIALVGVVQNGATPSALLRSRLTGIRQAFTSFWGAATNNAGRMTAMTQGDYNDDGYIDMTDLAVFLACGTRANVPQTDSDCRTQADFDGDADVDPNDFGHFQRLITGY